MSQYELDTFLTLEKTVWQALVTADRDADSRMLEDGFLGVYASGFSDKAGHVAQLDSGPTVAEYALDDARFLILGEGVVLLAYRAEFRRVGREVPEVMYVSSIWRETGQGWRNIFSQDTAVELPC